MSRLTINGQLTKCGLDRVKRKDHLSPAVLEELDAGLLGTIRLGSHENESRS